VLSMAAAVLAVFGVAGGRAKAEQMPELSPKREVDIYFGVGNFNHLQHEFVMKEAVDLGRRGGDITSYTGFAGGLEVGELDRICYRDIPGFPNYARLGHCQVVSMSIPEARLPDFVTVFLDEVAKRKLAEKGNQYRPVIGIKKGVKAPLFPVIEQAGQGRWRFTPGQGNDSDVFGKDEVYVYDSRLFPCRPAELYNQFADDLPEQFTIDYKQLEKVLSGIGYVTGNSCP